MGGLVDGGLMGAHKELVRIFQELVSAAADFKYWVDIQPVGKAFHPGGGDVRDAPAYKSAGQTLAMAQAVLKDIQRTECPTQMIASAVPVCNVIAKDGADTPS